MPFHQVLGHIGDAVAAQGRLDLTIGRVEDELAIDPDAQFAPIARELPDIERARADVALVNAGVVDQFPRGAAGAGNRACSQRPLYLRPAPAAALRS
ncbi:hypothetical protein XM25_13060 [Devosia sp. H5989]|nr:hypothetical protein XM25_13060 [Devosia sp. H5989]